MPSGPPAPRLLRSAYSSQSYPAPGNPSKPSDVEEAQKIQQEIEDHSHQGNLGNSTYVELQARNEIGSLTVDGKRKLSQASADSTAEKKSGGSKFFKILEEMNGRSEELENERRELAVKLEQDRRELAVKFEQARERRHDDMMGLANRTLDIFAKLFDKL
jgi:hypothetical protein